MIKKASVAKWLSGGFVGFMGFGIILTGTALSSPMPSALTPTLKDEAFVAVYDPQYISASEKPQNAAFPELSDLLKEDEPQSFVKVEFTINKREEDTEEIYQDASLEVTTTPFPSEFPDQTQPPVSSTLDPEKLFSMVNAHRQKLGLSAFQKNERVCSLATSRGPELEAEVAQGRMHAGLYNKNYPFWITENMIYMRSEEEALEWWLNSSIHRSQLEGEYQYSCTVCQGRACAQLFTNFVDKYPVAFATPTPLAE